MHRPVIILGAARTGTTLLARILGSSDEVFLITEIAPHLKALSCPEDTSGISDAVLWRRTFTFGAWQVAKPRPICERPELDPCKLQDMRRRYLAMAGDKKLVVKNPLGLARVDMLKIMFPEALFVFSLRAPWPTIQSAILKGNRSYIVPTDFVNSLPDNLLLRAAATWAESIDVFRDQSDDNWIVVRHEELIAKPQTVVSALYDRAGLELLPAALHAARLPEVRVRDYSFIKYQMMRHPHRAEIFALLEERAKSLGYDYRLSTLSGSGLRYAAGAWIGQVRQAKKPMCRKEAALLSRA